MRQKYYPFGETRSGASPTDRQFTGQRAESGVGSLYDFNARFYSPVLGRFLSADSIIPGAADGSGGGAATMGYDKNTRLTPLTPDFHEFLAQVGDENREVLQYGPFFLWDEKVRKEHNVPGGPLNPQALNRYAYCLNNPLRYVDPTGHDAYELTQEELELLLKWLNGSKGNTATINATGAGVIEALGLNGKNPPVILLGIYAEWNTEYTNTEFDSVVIVLQEALDYAKNSTSHTAILELKDGAFGMTADLRCVLCGGTIATIRYHYSFISPIPIPTDPAYFMVWIYLTQAGKKIW